MIDPKLLQYSALTIVLCGMFALLKILFERMFAQSDENLKFVRDQIEKANKRQEGNLQAWIAANKEQTAANITTAEALGRIQENLGEVLIAFRRMNGKGEHK